MLFEINNTKIEVNKLNPITNNHSASYISSQDDYLSKYLKDFNISNSNNAIHFTSNGRFALHDLIIYYASRINNANAIVSSFNISVEAAKKFVRAWDFGKFSSIKFILNAQKKSNFTKAIRIIENKFPIKFINIHAKVAVIWNDNYYITIITSGNLSSNNNIERGIIFFDKKTFDFDFNRMNNEFTS